MNIDFLATVNKSSETPLKTSGSIGAAAPGFREQINKVLRDNDRKNEYTVDKKPAGQQRSQVKAGDKTNAATKNDRKDTKYADKKTSSAQTTKYADDKTSNSRTTEYADNKTSDAQTLIYTEETSGTVDRKTASTDDDWGFYDELKETETSETDNIYVFTTAPDETPAPDGLQNPSVFSSTDADVFPLESNNDDSGLAAIFSEQEIDENADEGLDVNTAQNGNAGAAPVAVSEVILQMLAEQIASMPKQEAANGNVPQQNASFSLDDAKGLLAAMDETAQTDQIAQISKEVESTDTESARLMMNDIQENALLQKDQASAQNSARNDTFLQRGGEAKNEATEESKITENSEPVELSKESFASPSNDDDLLLERMAAQALRSRDNAAFVKTSEPIGKTVHAAETSVQTTSGTAKAEASVPTRSVDVPDKDFIVELAGRIQAQISGGREIIRVQLHPEELGRLEIRAESGRNGIIARIAAESVDVKKLLEGNLQNLQQALEARGLKIDRLHIVVEDNTYAMLADGGRYGNSGPSAHNTESSEFSKPSGMGIESPEENEAGDLSAEAEQRGVGFYTVA